MCLFMLVSQINIKINWKLLPFQNLIDYATHATGPYQLCIKCVVNEVILLCSEDETNFIEIKLENILQ